MRRGVVLSLAGKPTVDDLGKDLYRKFVHYETVETTA
jgi:hypothetical protein